jgi:aryl-alcohol dehydrogenase-like predicted oxidoreductase
MDYVEFGSTGLRVSRLAFGTGTNGWAGRSEQTDLGVGELARLLRLGHDHGVNFWDAADAYGSHEHLAEALCDIPRGEVVIATKTTSQSAQQTARDVERFLIELRTDAVDIVLLHCMTQAGWPRRYCGAMEALVRAKEQGKVRAVGVSCHGVGPLLSAAETDLVDVVLARINVAGVHMGAPRSEVVDALERLYTSGKAVYGMKVLGCGRLAGQAHSAMEYVFGLGIVHSIVVGTSSRAQLLENVKLVEEIAARYPLRSRAEGRHVGVLEAPGREERLPSSSRPGASLGET